MSQIIKYALNLVFRRKLRTLLTSLGITISVILLSFIIFGMKGLENALINEFTSRFDPNEITVFNDSRINAFASGMSQEDGRKKEKKYEVMNEEVVELIKNTQKAESVQPIIMIMTFDIYIDGIDDPYLDNNVVGMDSKGDDNFFVEYTKVSIDSDKYLDSENVYNVLYIQYHRGGKGSQQFTRLVCPNRKSNTAKFAKNFKEVLHDHKLRKK